jgi:hypothetical protein
MKNAADADLFQEHDLISADSEYQRYGKDIPTYPILEIREVVVNDS